MSKETDECEDWEDEEPAPDDEPLDYATELRLNRLLRELNESNPKTD